MRGLQEALAAIAPALVPTPRFAAVPVVLHQDAVWAFNGNLFACMPLQFDRSIPPEGVALDGTKLSKVWTVDSRLSIAAEFVTIIRGSSRFRLLRQDASLSFQPPAVGATMDLPPTVRDAILLAKKFASTNAVHAWACGVSVDDKGVTATNNQVLVHVPVTSPFSLTLPFWAVDVIKANSNLRIGWSDSSVAFAYSDGLHIQAQRLSAEMPPAVGRLAAMLDSTPDGLRVHGLAARLEELRAIEGRFCTLDTGALIVHGDNGEEAQAHAVYEVAQGPAASFRLSVETARLVFEHATSISFEQAPDRLVFSKDTYPALKGFAAGVR